MDLGGMVVWSRGTAPAVLLSTKIMGKIGKYMAIAENKDKLLKILQYVVKLVLVGRTSLGLSNAAGSAAQPDWQHFAAVLSLARRLGRLGNWVGAVDAVGAVGAGKGPGGDGDALARRVAALASLGNDLLDDWICLQRGRLLARQPCLDALDRWSTRLWCVSVTIELHFSVREMRARALRAVREGVRPEAAQAEQQAWLELLLRTAKQTCDWVFCAWELGELARHGHGSQFVPVLMGLSAAGLGTARAWRRLK